MLNSRLLSWALGSSHPLEGTQTSVCLGGGDTGGWKINYWGGGEWELSVILSTIKHIFKKRKEKNYFHSTPGN